MGWDHAEASTPVVFAILRRRTPGKFSQQADRSEYAEIHRCLGGEEHAPLRNSALFVPVSVDFQSCTKQAQGLFSNSCSPFFSKCLTSCGIAETETSRNMRFEGSGDKNKCSLFTQNENVCSLPN